MELVLIIVRGDSYWENLVSMMLKNWKKCKTRLGRKLDYRKGINQSKHETTIIQLHFKC